MFKHEFGGRYIIQLRVCNNGEYIWGSNPTSQTLGTLSEISLSEKV